MQPITPLSQSQDQAAAANITNPKDNQQPGTAFTRTVGTVHGHASTSAATLEQLTDDADMPSDTGLLARTITETQALSALSKPLTDDLQLPEGHTYQPYFWLSERAHRLTSPPMLKQTADMQSQVIGQLLMSESAAKQYFQSHLEYRFVDYGFTSVGASGMPEKNYGIFASKPLAKGALLGVYSGIGYLLQFEAWDLPDSPEEGTDFLHRKASEELPDFMSYYRTVMADLRGKEQTQRTISKYSLGVAAIDPSNYIAIVPDNERYTPMHLVNSADEPEDANIMCEVVTVNTGSDIFHIPVYFTTKEIPTGQELLASYYVKPDANKKRFMTRTAAEEKEFYKDILDTHLDSLEKLNRAESNRPPLSPYVAAPAINVSETIRKTFRTKVAKKHHSSGACASGD